ncbi:hypothetical protein [Streptomyces sp. WAC 06725]|uniref:hypothetical protein n=1 Tax=Streptomyces sp. WAC 06725 TaxID=2203209 RepID=UPI000F744AA6|nr:hypothetical protein [Streptomyces sp. WAC 06725]
MHMSDTFAGTAAALAPVIILVGVVELRAHADRFKVSEEANLTSAQDALHALDSATTRQEREQAFRQWQSSPSHSSLIQLTMGFIWAAVSTLLTINVYECLAYLADTSSVRGSDPAHSIVWSTTAGMAMLILFPLVTWARTTFTAQWRSSRTQFQVRQRMRSHRRAQPPSPPSP